MNRIVLHKMLAHTSFWALVAPMLGVVLLQGPGSYWPGSTTTTTTAAFTSGNITAVAADVDAAASVTIVAEYSNFPKSISDQLAVILITVGAIENMRQAWHAQAFSFDSLEQARLDLKSAIESKMDNFEMAARAMKTAATVALAASAQAKRIVGDLAPVHEYDHDNGGSGSEKRRPIDADGTLTSMHTKMEQEEEAKKMGMEEKEKGGWHPIDVDIEDLSRGYLQDETPQAPVHVHAPTVRNAKFYGRPR